jgi:translocation and assembly module TamA
LFVDAAIGGRSSAELDPDVYWSPGLGLRWGSPVGPFRFTFARSYVWDRGGAPDAHSPAWQFYLSFGEEF